MGLLPLRGEYAIEVRFEKSLGMLLFLVIALGTGWSQSNGGEPPADRDVQSPAPQPDWGPDSEAQMGDASSTSGLDQPSSGPPSASSRSRLLAGIHVSEGGESDPTWISGDSSQVSSVTNLLGSLSLVKTWRRSETSVDYVGGDTLYSSYAGLKLYNQQFQKLNADQTILWRRGQVAVKDSLYYIGKGDFAASSFGGPGSNTPPGTGVSNFFGASQSGIVQEPYITNASEV